MALRAFIFDERGQDLIEYTLLMAFVALASAALFLGGGGSISGIWTTGNSQLAEASKVVGGHGQGDELTVHAGRSSRSATTSRADTNSALAADSLPQPSR